ncbi:MAG: YiiX/YebB-like N1pC/P60 family cysteine hydrolase [Bdellovibrionota bacterium]
MKKIIFTFVILVSKIAFSEAALPVIDIRDRNAQNLKIADSVDAQAFSVEHEAFIRTLEENLVFREKTIEFLTKNPTAKRSGETYQNWVLQILQGTAKYLDTRVKFLTVASKYSVYKDLWGNNSSPPLTKKKMIMALAASLQLYDNYFSLFNLASKNKHLRTLLNQGDPTNNIPAGLVNSISSQANSWTLLSLLTSQVRGFDSFIKQLPASEMDAQTNYLVGVIQSSPSYQLFRNGLIKNLLSFAALRLISEKNRLLDALFSNSRDTEDLISKAFGNVVAVIETRQGKLNPTKPPGLLQKIETKLKPLDILLEKTPFRLTDRLIPGHWGHLALWIGSLEQLKEEGLWDLIADEDNQPAWKAMPLAKRQKIIQALTTGNVILEALRPGVQLNSLKQFMNVDDFLAIRPDYLQNDREIKAELIAQALTHFSKDYDFNFDAKTQDKIICSELVYWVFTDIPWLTENTFGRASISPDNVIHTVLNRNEFSAIMLYHDGKEVSDSGSAFRNELCSLQKYSTLEGVDEKCQNQFDPSNVSEELLRK